MTRHWHGIVLFTYFFIATSCDVLSQSSPYIFRHITIDDGLAGNDVRSIIQDDKGFLWIATNNGLQKFDGYTFTGYHHNPIDSQSLYSDNLISLLQDKQKNIWAISFLTGLNRFDPIANKSLRISNLIQNGIQELLLTHALCLDGKGNIWLVTSNRIAYYDVQTNKLIFPTIIFPEHFHPSFNDMKYDLGKNQLWIADPNNGMCMYDLDEKIFYNRENNPDSLPVFRSNCKPILCFIDKENNIWFNGSDGYLEKYNLTSRKIETYGLDQSSDDFSSLHKTRKSTDKLYSGILTLTEDSHGNIWMAGGYQGLYQYMIRNDSFSVIHTALTNPNGFFLNTNTHCICEDREGNIWIGTDRGINIFNPLRQPFHFFENDPKRKFSYTQNETEDFLQANSGELWVASWGGGVTVFDSSLHYEKYLLHNPEDPHSLAEPANRVWALIKNPEGKIFMGCQHGFISEFDPNSKTLLNYHPEGLANRTILNMGADKEQNIWMALYSGLGKWNPKSLMAVNYSEFIPYEGIRSSTASDILPDDSGNVWVATWGIGLQKFDATKNRFTEIFVPEKNNVHSISSTVINCMIRINDSLMAIGTGTGGIDIFNQRSKQFYSINTTDGLPSNNVSALYYVPPNSLWASGGNQFCKINLQSRQVTRFGPQDGIKNLDFSSCHHMYKMQDGRIFVGYTGGFLYFYPDSISAGGPPFSVSLTGIKIFDQLISIDSILRHGDTLSLTHKQNFITIQFASLSYWEVNRIKYYYQLEGIDPNWVDAGNQRFANYTNLPAGSFRFRIKCQNSDGASCKEMTYLFINIEPPYWQTWWFKILIVLVAALALYILYRYRINQILRLQTVRNEISKDLHDDVGSTLSSISILSEEAKYKLKEGKQEQSSSIMSKISNYALEMVEKMGDIVWAVNSDNDSIQDIIPRLKNSFIETCALKGIRLEFHSDPGFERKILPMQARKNIYLICKEAINNSIKYADCSEIIVNCQMVAAGMEISISDNGKGFDSAKHADGNGLRNMRARATELKGTLSIYSGQGHTVIAMRIPVPRIR